MKFSLQHNRIQLSQSTFLYGLVKRREIEDPVRDRDKEKQELKRIRLSKVILTATKRIQKLPSFQLTNFFLWRKKSFSGHGSFAVHQVMVIKKHTHRLSENAEAEPEDHVSHHGAKPFL